ncbi:MAG TPA: nuclear transport factor 2 family protein [Ktedonobacterales bacterium]
MSQVQHSLDLTREQVHQRCEERTQAERQGDAAALEQMLDDDYIGIGPRGFVLTKAQWLDRFRSGELRYDAFSWDEERIRVFGDDGGTAIVTGRETSSGTYRGQAIQGQYRVTQVYVRQEYQWRLVSLQLSMYPPAS